MLVSGSPLFHRLFSTAVIILVLRQTLGSHIAAFGKKSVHGVDLMVAYRNKSTFKGPTFLELACQTIDLGVQRKSHPYAN